MNNTTTYRMDRPHRFDIGECIRHVDSPSILTVVELSARLTGDGVLVPTYTIRDNEGETATDVLDTNDLVSAHVHSARV